MYIILYNIKKIITKCKKIKFNYKLKKKFPELFKKYL